MKRTPLSIGSTIQAKGGSSYTYIIDRVIGDGASSIVYEAHYVDHSNHKHYIRLKECYPYQSSIERNGKDLIWSNENERTNDIVAFKNGYDTLMKDQKSNYIVHAFDQFESNNTMYIVMDANEGVTFDKTDFDSLKDILSTIKLLAHVVGEYHQKGYLHLDIKPSNFLVYPRPSEHIVLFDVDSVTLKDDIKNKKIKCVSYSKGWAAPEQMQGRIDKLCPATDIYSIGAILFQKIMGRAVENEDIGIFADWDFEGELFDDVNPAIKRLLREIFKNTLAANIKRRYQTANELISALEEARKVAEQEVYLINEDVFSETTFVGREKDITNIHDLFSNGTKAIFLHGFSGVGKTALTRRFAELYAADYDCVQFHRYTKGLATIIDNYMLNTKADDQISYRKQLRKICDNAKALIIIDNFDVKEDENIECLDNEDLEYLLSLNANIIITTRDNFSHHACEKINVVKLEAQSTNELISVFVNEYGKELNKNEEESVLEIFDRYENNTLVVKIVAKQIIVSQISILEFLNSIKDSALSRFDEDNEDIVVKDGNRYRKVNALHHLREVFGIYCLPERHKLILRYLDLLKYHRCLTIKEYRRLTGEKNLNVLNDLEFRNLVSFVKTENNEDTEIKVHQLIYDFVEKDDTPTYQNVPGIVSYIDNCFHILDEIIHEEADNAESSIDFEKASCITFALLMHDDIRRTEDEDSIAEKFALLYAFMSIAFLADPAKTYELFFESSRETMWYFYVNGIMDWYYFFPHELDASIEVADAFVQGQDSIIVTYSVMSYFFHQKSGNVDSAKKAIDDIIAEEMHEVIFSSNSGNRFNYADYLLFKLKWYLSICRYAKRETGFIHNIEDSIAVSVGENYAYYWMVFNLLKKAIKSGISEQKVQDCLKEAEWILILLEQCNERFATFGLTADDIMSYTPPTTQEREENISRHWSKKADIWYKSVDNMLSKVNNPYEAYSMLLSDDYHKEFLNNSKIQKLIVENLVDKIYNDARLTLEEKSKLLIDHVMIQIKKLRIKKNTPVKASTIKKILPKAELYYQALSKINYLTPNWKEEKFDAKQVEIIDAALDLRKVLEKEFFDINDHVHSICMSINNIDYVGEMLYLADKLHAEGWAQKAEKIKSQILDLTMGCLALYPNSLSGHTLQMILYKVRPIAVKHNRQDVVSAIDKIQITSLARRYYLNLIDPFYDVVAMKYEEQDALARKFMDDYIDMVAMEAYEKTHGVSIVDTEVIDEMEQLLSENLEELLWATDVYNSHYREIFYYPHYEDWHRSLHPYWAREFHDIKSKEVNIGLCYLVAQSAEDIPFNDAVEESINYLTEDENYNLSKEELQTVLDNIKRIYPKFKG